MLLPGTRCSVCGHRMNLSETVSDALHRSTRSYPFRNTILNKRVETPVTHLCARCRQRADEVRSEMPRPKTASSRR